MAALPLLAALLALPASAMACAPPAGWSELSLTVPDVGEVRYTAWLPEVPPGERVPLVVSLHYGGTVTPYYGGAMARDLVKPALQELGAAIIAPDCPGPHWGSRASELAVLALMDHALANWPVAPERVVLTGYSMGGMGTWIFAGTHGERFAAAVPMGGRPIDPERVTRPIYAIHGSEDELFAISEVEQAIAGRRAAGVTAEVVVARGLSHYQTSRYRSLLAQAVPWLEERW